jgi:glycosyltransferase involved in cell wall biosynthesis
MRILIATDAWRPQVNGVVHTLEANAQAAKTLGADVVFLTPEGFWSVGLPSYPGIRLALPRRREIFSRIAVIQPDAIHIATEGTIGHFARWYCLTERLPFTTSFHTRFADYASARFPVPQGLTWAWLRWFHNAGRGTMVSTPSLAAELRQQGFHTVLRWPRGVDSRLFHPDHAIDPGLPRPIFLAVGRLAVEKNLEAFLSLDLPGSKVVVGDGPMLDKLKRRYPEAHFLGRREGKDLARLYASADAFVFPSRTDTFGLVLLEALASGVPVAAYPVPGPLDVIGDSGAGVLDEDLRRAALAALEIPREHCRAHALRFTWPASADQFVANLCPLR